MAKKNANSTGRGRASSEASPTQRGGSNGKKSPSQGTKASKTNKSQRTKGAGGTQPSGGGQTSRRAPASQPTQTSRGGKSRQGAKKQTTPEPHASGGKKRSNATKTQPTRKAGGGGSTGGQSKQGGDTGPEKSRIAALVEAPVQPNEYLSAKDLDRYRKLLILKRAELLGDLTSMSDGALRLNDAANLSHMPIHMADIGSEQFDQELTLDLVQSEQQLLEDIDHALERITDGTYGICEDTGKPIGKARLNIKPWAKHSIDAERERERHDYG